MIENDADPLSQFESLRRLRQLLASNKELPIKATIQCVVSRQPSMKNFRLWGLFKVLQSHNTAHWSIFLALPLPLSLHRSGVLPKLVQMLSWDHAPDVQYEAAWVLTNVSSGTPEQVR
jgi:importin subunit alpha-2